jgi:hypothetical protein
VSKIENDFTLKNKNVFTLCFKNELLVKGPSEHTIIYKSAKIEF